MVVRNLPYTAAPFVGRASEISEITDRLSIPGCRLLTLAGPGGIGKTRLAMQVAANCAEQFDDGIYFVPLQPLDSSEFIISAIADALRFPLTPGKDPKQQLLQYLREKALLLLLDNFEHLLNGAELLSEVLAAAPDVKLLVTSREVLSLQEEWLYPIRGLQYPETAAAGQPGAYSAIQLFVERARQVRGSLSVVDEQTAVIRICQLVEGMPLALELAAGWAKALRAAEIVTEIQRSLDFLSTSLRNVPQRHQSITAVFEQTWGRLSAEERRVFSALAVFSGGFRREAAEAVTRVSLRILSDLVDKSLLTRDPDGRYQIHELLRQYGQTRLEITPDDTLRVHELHAAYYARFLHERQQDLDGDRQREACLEIEAELDNIRTAWSWAVEHSIVEHIDQAAYPLFRFYTTQGRFLEGSDTFEKAERMLDNGDPRTEICLATVLCSLGWMYFRGSPLEKARKVLERSWQIYSQHGVLPAPGSGSDPRLGLSFMYILLADFSTAETLAQDALRDHTLRDDPHNLTFACYELSQLAWAQGQYEAARQFARQGYEAAARSSVSIRANSLQQWAEASQALGDLADAKQRFQAAYTLLKAIGEPEGTSRALLRLGRIALLEGDNAEARRYYEQALTVGHGFSDQATIAMSLTGMGNTTCAMGHYGEAWRYFREALQVSTKYFPINLPPIFIGVGDLFLQTRKQTRGIELLAIALNYPGTGEAIKDRAHRLLNQYQATEKASQQTLTPAEFDAVASALLDELLINESKPLTHQTAQADETLIEPLSEREFEILKLIADGLSNRTIADQLILSVGTVKWYTSHIFSKLGVQSRTQALVRAHQLNLLP
jgi:predicted ATPase/DNA-binding CsgD family transcriptional regulator